MDTFKDYVSSVWNYVSELFEKKEKLPNNLTDEEVNEFLSGEGETQEEKDVIERLCMEIDERHRLEDDLFKYLKEHEDEPDLINKWVSSKVRELLNDDSGETPSDEDVEKIKDFIEERMNERMEQETDALFYEEPKENGEE